MNNTPERAKVEKATQHAQIDTERENVLNEVIRLGELISECRGYDTVAPAPNLEEVACESPSLYRTLVNTPKELAAIADKLNEHISDLSGLLFHGQ